MSCVCCCVCHASESDCVCVCERTISTTRSGRKNHTSSTQVKMLKCSMLAVVLITASPIMAGRDAVIAVTVIPPPSLASLASLARNDAMPPLYRTSGCPSGASDDVAFGERDTVPCEYGGEEGEGVGVEGVEGKYVVERGEETIVGEFTHVPCHCHRLHV